MGKKAKREIPLEDIPQKASTPALSWTVFLVEDSEDDRHLAQRILKLSPRVADVISLADSASLFRELENRGYYRPSDEKGCLILMDIHMPGRNGLTLLEQLKSNPHTENIPIVMITGDAASDKIHQSYMLNASAFIAKPFTEKHLDDLHAVFDKGTGWKEKCH
jgi:two-component system, chemotaxis family, response regulator Rcp1